MQNIFKKDSVYMKDQPAKTPVAPVEVSSSRETPFHTRDETTHQLLMEIRKEIRTIDSFESSVAISQTAYEREQTFGISMSRFVKFVNDGTDSIYLAFDDNTTENPTVNVIEVKTGEVVENFPRAVNRLVVRAKTGSQPFRCWGVR